MVLPIIIMLIDNYASYAVLAGVFVLRTIIDSMNMFPSTFDYYFAFVPLYVAAAFLSLMLAVERLCSNLRGEILSLGWSQF